MRRLPVSWPLAALCLGLPAWWLAGMADLAVPLLALPMAWQLWRRAQRGEVIRAPGGFALWLLFLAVLALSALTLWAQAPGAQPGGGLGRFISYAVTASYYLAATVVLLWIGNLPERDLPTMRAVRLLGALFIVSAAGGWLGLIASDLELTSLLEWVLPTGLQANTYVHQLIDPVTAQVQQVLGYREARPAAPYSFTNAWGANTAIYLPFFVVGWLSRDAGWRRPVGFVVLAATTVPIVYSLNRGMWIGIVVLAVLATARLALMGRLTALVAMIVGAGLAAGAVGLTPLGAMVIDRLNTGHSNERRADLATATLTSATASPVVGFGTTREVQGNFSSVAGGATDDCPRCAAPPFGTHGHLYRLAFTEGYLGLLLYLGFLVRRLARHARSRDPVVIAVNLATALSLLFLLYYNLLPHAIFVVFAGLGLAWRLDRAPAPRPAAAAVVPWRLPPLIPVGAGPVGAGPVGAGPVGPGPVNAGPSPDRSGGPDA